MIEIIKKRLFENDQYTTIEYTLSNNVQRDIVEDIISYFENETTRMRICHCSSFDDDGHPLHRCYHAKSELVELADLPSPYISFTIDFSDTEGKYVHSVLMHINSNIVTYYVDKKKLH